MARLVEQATSRQSPSEAAVARFAKIYTPLILLACILLAFVPWSDPNADRKWWVYLALQVLVTACPCALVLSTPVTMVSALARAAQVGVLVKGGVVLETLRDVKVLTLDKTGTLTVGAFLVEAVTVAPWTNEADVLRLLGSLERGSSHPLAAAIVGRAAARGVTCDGDVKASSVVPGFGIMGDVEGHAVRAGTSEFLRQLFAVEGCIKEEFTLLDSDAAKCENRGVTTCFVAIDGKYAACITARDALRPEATEAVTELKAMGITPAMLTGDNESVARAIGAAAGIEPEHIHAALLPQDKLDLVSTYNIAERPSIMPSKLKRFVDSAMRCGRRKKVNHVRVAHVGDGVNDAPALAAADVGIAMGVAGAAAALDAGDVALFTNDLRVLPALQRLARAAGRKIVFNITLSVVTKIIVLALAACGKFTLFGAVLVDVGTALLVTLNGLTLLRWDFGLGDAPSVCVGAAAVGAHSHGGGKAGGDGCCSSSSCCAPKKNVELSSCCANGSCGPAKKAGNNKSCGGNVVASACCEKGAEEAAERQPCCGDHDHHGHDHNHDHHDHKHTHEHGVGKCTGDHSHHDHAAHNHDSHSHNCSHDHHKDKHSNHSHDHAGQCCGGHNHSHNHEDSHGHSHSQLEHGSGSGAHEKRCCDAKKSTCGHSHEHTSQHEHTSHCSEDKGGCCGDHHHHHHHHSPGEKAPLIQISKE